MADVVSGLPVLNAEVIPKKQEDFANDSVINWTTMFLTLFFFPAFVAFQGAIQETINYNLPQPNSGIVWFNTGGHNNTLVQCYAPVSTGSRVAWAWGSFVLLLGFGLFMALIILWIHAHYYGWHKFALSLDARLTRGERLALMAYQQHEKRLAELKKEAGEEGKNLIVDQG